jgi:hypothetical protein
MVGWKKQAPRLAGIASMLVATPALPCSRLCDDPPIYLWPKRAEVPGNLIRFRVLVPDPGRLELRNKAGVAIVASIKSMGQDRVFAPDAPVAAGTELTLHYEFRCGDPRKLHRGQGKFTFEVGPPSSIELRGASLTLYEQGTRDPGSAYNESGFVRLRYLDPESSGNAGHLIQSTVTLDGRPYEFDQSPLEGTVPTIEVVSDCMLRDTDSDAGYQIDSCGKLRSVPPGEHTVEVKPHLVGGEAKLAPVSLKVTTFCPRGLIPTPAASNLKPIPLPSVSARAAGSVQGRSASPVKRTPKPKSTGCALGAEGREGAPTLALVTLAALAAKVRRRRRPLT